MILWLTVSAAVYSALWLAFAMTSAETLVIRRVARRIAAGR